MKKAIFIVLPLLLVGGGVVGAAMMGVINVPGLSPAKKKAAATKLYTEEKEEEPVVKREAPPENVEPPKPDMVRGRKALAKLWNEMDSTVIAQIAADWKDEELAQQLQYLQSEKTAEVLTTLAASKPERASKVSKLLQEIASKPPETS